MKWERFWPSFRLLYSETFIKDLLQVHIDSGYKQSYGALKPSVEVLPDCRKEKGLKILQTIMVKINWT